MRTMLGVAALFLAHAAPLVAQAHSGPVEIPLRVAGGRLLVPVEAADGSHFEFALTTGSAVTVLSETGATRAGRSGQLALGGLPVPLEGSATVPDDALRVDGRVLDGMISPNMLSAYDVLIDAPGGRVVLKPAGRSLEWDGMMLSDPIRLRVFHGIVLSLDVQLGGKDYPAMLDLGTPTVVVNAGVKGDLGLDDDDVGTLRVGDLTMHDTPVRVRDLEVFRRWTPDGSGFVLVGAVVARECAISLSWVHREMRTCVR